MKKLFTLLLTLVATTALWAEDFEVDGIYYSILGQTNNVQLTHYGRCGHNNGYDTIPETITYNGTTFSVISIGDEAFIGCFDLKSIIIPNSVINIGEGAFRSCFALTTITIPNSVTSLEAEAFAHCYGLTAVTIGNSVTYIGKKAFVGCFGLTSVTIPNSVTTIVKEAFAGCKSLTSVVWNAENCADFSSNEYAPFYDIRSQISSFVFGDSVQHIPTYLCYGMENLTSITIPYNITSVGGRVFKDCSSLTEIIWNAANFVDISFDFYEENAALFYDICSQITSFTFGDSVKHIPAYMCYGMNNLTSITIPNSVTSIGRAVFVGCSSLTSVTIPNSVTSIGEQAFAGCFALSSVTILNGVTSIERGTFQSCFNLTSVAIPNSVTSIGSYAFYNCSGLTSITIPNSVTAIGWGAFYGCPSLTSVVWNAENCADFSWEDGNDAPFYNIRSQITSFTFGDSVQHIPAYLCYEMDNLTSMNIPNSIMSIGDSAFIGCSGLTSITIPNSVTSIGDGAFYGCSGLTSVTIGNSVTSIGYDAFKGCSSLTSVTIGSKVASIGYDAFKGCSSLRSIVWNAENYSDFKQASSSIFYDSRSQITSFNFGDSVQHIPAYLCYGMSGLREISLGSQVKTIGAEAFALCPRIYEVTCLAQQPPVAELSSFTNYDAYFHAPCDAQRYYSVDPVWKNFHNVECIVTENTVMDDITITPSDYEATVVWLSHEHAATYSLVITKSGDTYCTLTFNKYGQLINIALAPARVRAKQDAAEYTETGYSFTITGLDAATTYDYTFSVLNDAHETIDVQYGTFTTQNNTPTALDNTDSPYPITDTRKEIRNGQLIILREGVEYNAQGVRL